MNTELVLSQLQKALFVSEIKTILGGINVTFTIVQAMPCAPDIYAVFRDSDGSFYALQNIGAQLWIKFSSGDFGENRYFVLPITNYLIENRENSLVSFVKSCRFGDLGDIPVRSEIFTNPFLEINSLNQTTETEESSKTTEESSNTTE